MAEPRRPASRGGPKGRPPPGLPPAINHLPFSIRPGDVRARGRRASFSSFASSMVLAYGQVLVQVIAARPGAGAPSCFWYVQEN